jgi:hypothetical protein
MNSSRRILEVVFGDALSLFGDAPCLRFIPHTGVQLSMCLDSGDVFVNMD